MGAAVCRSSAREPRSTRLEAVFADCFYPRFGTRLVGGASEPLYTPPTQESPEAVIYYRDDYFASALHEVAHWCIAGQERRLREDFGYWYAPDGRNSKQQRAFERVESKPQALEWFFSKACGIRFRVSVDNLQAQAAGDASQQLGFQQRVLDQALCWQRESLPERAQIFYVALSREFHTHRQPSELEFSLAELV